MFLENQLTRAECRGLNLEALLIKPVQVRLIEAPPPPALPPSVRSDLLAFLYSAFVNIHYC